MGRLQVCGLKRVPYPAMGMTIFREELAKNLPPVMTEKMKQVVIFKRKSRPHRYYTLGDNLTVNLKNVFKGGDYGLNHLLNGR